MVTFYKMEEGYSPSVSKDKSWQILQAEVYNALYEIENNPVNTVTFEMYRYYPQSIKLLKLSEFAEYTQIYLNDAVGFNSDGEIVISASGGGTDRDLKEFIAKSFCMHIFMECAKVGVAVNISVS